MGRFIRLAGREADCYDLCGRTTFNRGRWTFISPLYYCDDNQTRERTALSGVAVTAGPVRPWQRGCRAWPVAPELVSPGATLVTATKPLAKDRRHRIGWRGAGGCRRYACQQHRASGSELCVFMASSIFGMTTLRETPRLTASFR